MLVIDANVIVEITLERLGTEALETLSDEEQIAPWLLWSDTLTDRQVFSLDEMAWDEFVEILDRPSRSVPEFARLLSSVSVFDD